MNDSSKPIREEETGIQEKYKKNAVEPRKENEIRLHKKYESRIRLSALPSSRASGLRPYTGRSNLNTEVTALSSTSGQVHLPGDEVNSIWRDSQIRCNTVL